MKKAVSGPVHTAYCGEREREVRQIREREIRQILTNGVFVCVKIAQLKDFAKREPQTKASETDEMREREMDSSAHEDVREAQAG